MNKEADTYKIFRQLEERKKRANPYSFYDKDELIDEILKNEDELERYKNIIDKTVEYVERLTNGKTSRIDTWENVEFVLETILSILKGE